MPRLSRKREDRRRGTVGGGAAVEKPERLGDLRRLRVHLERDLLLKVRFGVQRAVVVVLGRHRAQGLFSRSVFLEVTRGEEREHAGRRTALGEDGMPPVDRLGHQRAARRHLAHLLRPDGEDKVVLAGGHSQRGVAHRLDAGGAVGSHTRHGNGEEIEGIGDESARVAFEAIEEGLVAAEPGGLELSGLDARVSHGEVGGLEDHVGEALMEVLAELDRARADDRDLAAESTHRWSPCLSGLPTSRRAAPRLLRPPPASQVPTPCDAPIATAKSVGAFLSCEPWCRSERARSRARPSCPPPTLCPIPVRGSSECACARVAPAAPISTSSRATCAHAGCPWSPATRSSESSMRSALAPRVSGSGTAWGSPGSAPRADAVASASRPERISARTRPTRAGRTTAAMPSRRACPRPSPTRSLPPSTTPRQPLSSARGSSAIVRSGAARSRAADASVFTASAHRPTSRSRWRAPGGARSTW